MNRRALAVGGIVGPAGFVTAWTLSGLTTDGYSPIDGFISDLAALGAPSRAAMTTGFVCFGIAVPAYAFVLRDSLDGRAWIAAAATGLTTLGVASFPLEGSDLQSKGHALFAGLGYVTLALTPLLAARPLERLGHRRAALASLAAGVVSGAALAATTLGPAHGALQRIGLTTTDVWIAATAVAILRGKLPHPFCEITGGASRGSRRPARALPARSRPVAARRRRR
ncbi:MAG: DUF998 domain-containing protein [Acidimicrobiales bacterium]